MASSLLLVIGCDLTGPDADENGEDTTPTAVTFVSAEQTGGTSGATDSTGLILTFDVDPTTLAASDITVTGATKGALSATGTTRSLALSDITVGDGETVSVTIANPSGFTISGSPQTAVVYRAPTAVTFESAVQTGGSSGTADSTGLTLTFDVDPTTLAASDITVTGATEGALSGTGTTRSLAISNITVDDRATVSVAIADPSGFTINGSPKTAMVYRELTIGMPYQGGKIAYIFQSGDPGYVSGETHGIIAATADLGTVTSWSNTVTTTGATSQALGTGEDNTTDIVTNQGAGSYAAYICDDHTNTDTGTGAYSDWFLPSKDELHKLWISRADIGGFTTDASGDYWSSSEDSTDKAWYQNFGDNVSRPTGLKDASKRVRAIRYF